MTTYRRNFYVKAMTVLCFVTVLVTSLSTPGIQISRAQEATDEPPVVTPESVVPPTESLPPTVVQETPTSVITEEPTAVATQVATELPTEQPPTPLQVPSDATSFVENFETSGTSYWTLSPGWTLSNNGMTTLLTTEMPLQTAMINGLVWEHIALSAQIGVGQSGIAEIAFRVGGERYSVTVDAAGNVNLLRNGQLLAVGLGVNTPPTDSTLVNYTLNLIASGGSISVSVNGNQAINFIDPAPLLAGGIVFGSSEASMGVVTIDNIAVEKLPAPVVTPDPTEIVVTPDVTPTQQPPVETTEEPTIEPTVETLTPNPEVTSEVEPETTPDVSLTPDPEVTVEVDPEVTPEVSLTPNPEVTPEIDPEVTPEINPEVTPEIDPEITPEPAPAIIVDEEVSYKIGSVLTDVVTLYNEGGQSAVEEEITTGGYETDEAGRLTLAVWKNETTPMGDIIALVESVGGEVIYVNPNFLEAYLPVASIIPVATLDIVQAITLPPRVVGHSGGTTTEAVATAQNILASDDFGTIQSTGSVVPHSLDIISANDWHELGVLGSGTNGPVNIAVIDSGFVAAGNTSDQACIPNPSRVWNDGSTGDAKGSNSNGLLVAEVICDIAPNADVYQYRATNGNQIVSAINDAVTGGYAGIFPAADVIMIALDPSTINTSQLNSALQNAYDNNIPVIAAAGDTGGNSSASFVYTGGTSTVTVFVNENFDPSSGDRISVTVDSGVPYGTTAEIANSSWSESNGAAGTVQYPGSVVDFEDACGTECQIVLTISGAAAGTANTQYTVTVTDGVVTPDSTVDMVSGTELTEIAQQDLVISVAAACAQPNAHYPIKTNSSTGTVGQPNTFTIKPSLAAPAGVGNSITGTGVEDCNVDDLGFDGTASSAAHVAGMTALLLSNPNMSTYFTPSNPSAGYIPDTVKHYLQTRALDVNNNGFDNVYGAGLAVLGNPAFSFSQQQYVPRDASRFSGQANVIYVSTGYTNNTSTEADGSSTRPYTHPAHAMEVARTNGSVDTVILMPGEYPAGLEIPSGVTVISFAAGDAGISVPTTFWVNDTLRNRAGIVIQNATNVRVEGLTFNSADPLYSAGDLTLRIERIRPLEVFQSTNVTIVDNTFNDFDAPIRVDGSAATPTDNVLFDDNSFVRFNVGNVNSVAVLDIKNSGLNQPVVLFGNTFLNNQVPTSSTSPNMEAIVSVTASEVEILSNRFNANAAEAVIYIDQWINEPTDTSKPVNSFVSNPVTIFGSVFQDNILGGSLVHLYQGNRFVFINNTVANNSLATTPWKFNIITMGYDPVGAGAGTPFGHLSDHQYDIHNNVFYNNSQGSGRLIDDAQSWDIGCTSALGLGTGAGAQNNWFIAQSYSGGECNNAINTAANGNLISSEIDGIVYDVDTEVGREQLEAVVFFTTVNDPNDPYRLRPLADEITSDQLNPAIDPGTFGSGTDPDDLVVPAILSATNAPQAIDAAGFDRFLDQATGNQTTIDRGAYEATAPDPVRFIDTNEGDTIPPDDFGTTGYKNYVDGTGNFTYVTTEDTDFINIDLRRYVTQGFQPYQYNINALTTVFDGNPNNACLGQTYLFDPQTYILTYCPPENFHNEGVSGTADDVQFQYVVTGALDSGTTGTGVVSVQVLAEDDGVPTVNPDTQYLFVEPGDLLETRLRPFVTFDPFSVSDSDSSVDYPFTYNSIDILSGLPDFTREVFPSTWDTNSSGTVEDSEIEAQLQTILSDGVFDFTSVPGVLGSFEFTYNVTDRDGQSPSGTSDRHIRVVIVENIATAGIYDDTSLPIRYMDTGWEPLYFEPGYNRTLHESNGANQRFEMTFLGDAFVINHRGWSGGGRFTVEVDHNDDGVYDNVLTGSIPGIVCYGGVDAGGGNFTAQRPQTGDYYVGCSLDDSNTSGQLRRLRVTAIDLFYLDSVEILDTSALTTGMTVDQSEFGLEYNGNWQVWEPSSPYEPKVGEDIFYTNDASATLSFDVDTTNVADIVVYHYVHPAHGTIEICRNTNENCQTTSLTNSNVEFQRAWVVPISNLGLNANTIERVTIRSTGSYINLDAIQIRSALAVGDAISESDPIVVQNGDSWRTWNNASAYGGTTLYNNLTDQTLSISLNTTGAENLVLYHYVNSQQGTARVCNAGTCVTRDFNSSQTIFRNAWIIPLSDLGIVPGSRATVTLQPQSGFVNLSGAQLIGSIPTLTVEGGIYDEKAVGISRLGNWLTYVDSGHHGGTALYTNDNGATITFDIDTTGAQDLVIYHYLNSVQGNVEVCRNSNDDCRTYGQNASTAQFRRALIIPFSDLNLSANSVETITVRQSSQYVNFDAVQLRPGPLAIGTFYEETDSAITKSGNWLTWVNTGHSGSTVVYSNASDAFITFEVDTTSVDYILLHHYINSVQGSMQICRNTNDNCVTRNLNGADLTFGQVIPISVSDLGMAANSVEQVTLRPSSGYVNLDGVELVSGLPVLDINGGYYNEDAVGIIYSGNWQTWFNSANSFGSARYGNSNGANVTFNVDTTDATDLVVYYYANSVQGSVQVCRNSNDNCQTRSFFNSDLQSKRAWVIPLSDLGITPGSTSMITLRRQSGYANLDGVQLRDVMVVDELYQQDASEITLQGNWQTYNERRLLGGASIYANDLSGAALFKVDMTNVNYLVVHHYTNSVQGTMQVCYTSCATLSLSSSDSQFQKQWIIDVDDLGLPSTGEAEIEITTLSDYINISGIEPISSLPSLTAGETYDQDDFGLVYSGSWLNWENASHIGGSAAYTNDPSAELTFQVDTTNMSSLIVSYYTNSVQGTMQVCRNSNDSCQTRSLTSGTTTYRNDWVIPAGDLGLGANTVETITIRTINSYINVDAITIAATTRQELQPGQVYEENSLNIALGGSGTWQSALGSSFGGGSLAYNNTAGASVEFDLAQGSTGFILYVTRGTSMTSDLEVCYKEKSDVTSICSVVSETVNTRLTSGSNQVMYGFAFPGLPSDVAYTVFITNGNNGQYFSFDRIAVLDDPSTSLMNNGSLASDNTDTALLYSPGSEAWLEFNSTRYGLYQGTQSYTSQSGATVQFEFEGNALTLYQRVGQPFSDNARLCVVTGDTVEPSRLNCVSFSQFRSGSSISAQVPITFYGFGSGTHHVIIENLDYGKILNIDAILVQ